MIFELEMPAVKGLGLSLAAGSFFSRAKILKDGNPLNPVKGIYTVSDSAGQEIKIQLTHSLIDPVPALVVNGEKHQLVAPFKWYEYAWAGAPALMMFHGGALGAVIGVSAAHINAKAMRSGMNPFGKYVSVGFITVLSVAVYLAAAVFVASVFTSDHDILVGTAKEINKDLPKTLDPTTIFESVKVEGEKQFVYYYRVNLNGRPLDYSNLDKKVRETALKTWCTDPEMDDFRRMKAEIVYRYQDTKGKALGPDIVIKTTDCP